MTANSGPKNSVMCVKLPGCDAPFHAGRDQVRIVFLKVRHHGPRLARLQFLEAGFQHARGGRINGPILVFRSQADPTGMLSHGIAQRAAEVLVVVDLFFQDQQRRGGAFLAA